MILYAGGFRRPPVRSELQRYMRGECAYLALALASAIRPSEVVLLAQAHFAVRDHAGQFWDIRGRLTPEQVWDGLPPASRDLRVLTREQVMEELATGLYSDGPHVPHRERLARRLVADLAPEVLAPGLPASSGARAPRP